LKKLGPGIIFAGAAIGVSHLVQSTRAGADFGWGLLWAFFLVNLFKYPFFQYGARYATVTNQSLIDGYGKLGKKYLWIYFFINIINMFTIQTAVTIVTAGLTLELLQIDYDIKYISIIITYISMAILLLGRYKTFDKIIKFVILLLSICSITAFVFAFSNNEKTISLTQVFPLKKEAFIFLIAFMGWMPAPLDISVWHSLWAVKKNQLQNKKESLKQGLFDFNIGYITTLFLGVIFIGLGFFVMYESGIVFSNSSQIFAEQFINLYTSLLGKSIYIIIAIAAFTTMFSTTLTTLDGLPRVMSKISQLLLKKQKKEYYIFWIIILALGTSLIFFWVNEMGFLVKIATLLSFATAPFYAILNYKLVIRKDFPKHAQPKKPMKILSISGIIFLIAFTLAYLLFFI